MRVGAATGRDGERRIEDVGHDDLGGPGSASRRGRQHADRPRAGDEHALAQHGASSRHRVQRDRERFGEGRFRERHLVRHRMRLGGVAHQHLAEAALHVREPHGAAKEPHVRAVALSSGLAEPAAAAGPARVHRDLLAGAQRRHLGPDLGDGARNLVAQDHRLPEPH